MGFDAPVIAWGDEEGVDAEIMRERLGELSDSFMAEKTEAFGPDTMRQIEKQVLLQTIDTKWREHLLTLEHLRSVVGFRGYAQRDPLNEYKTEAFQLFESMLESLRERVTEQLGRIRPMSEEEQRAMMQQMATQQAQLREQAEQSKAVGPTENVATPAAGLPLVEGFDETDPATWGNPSRNDPCPCGSGQKFKHCHGRLA